MVQNKVKIGEQMINIDRYDVMDGFDLVIYAGRNESIQIHTALLGMRPASIKFYENDTKVADALVVMRQQHLEADQEGTRGQTVFFVVDYAPTV